jgi:hypothetical protein
MILEDLEYVFKKQIDAGEKKLYFMLVDGKHKVVERHPANKMEELLPMLSAFEYAGTDVMPRFTKGL